MTRLKLYAAILGGIAAVLTAAGGFWRTVRDCERKGSADVEVVRIMAEQLSAAQERCR